MSAKKITLVYYANVGADAATLARQARAQQTWDRLDARLLAFEPRRSALDIGDANEAPYVRDMIEETTRAESEIIAITNTDISFGFDLRREIVESVERFGCFWSFRAIDDVYNTDGGADFFAFTRDWWSKYELRFPDFLLGNYYWDDVLIRIMIASGCTERRRCYFHESHVGSSARLETPAGIYNKRLGLAWYEQNGVSDGRPSPL